MDIDFVRNKDRIVFNDEKLLIRAYGSENARRIMRRMSELRMVHSLQDVPVTPPAR